MRIIGMEHKPAKNKEEIKEAIKEIKKLKKIKKLFKKED